MFVKCMKRLFHLLNFLSQQWPPPLAKPPQPLTLSCQSQTPFSACRRPVTHYRRYWPRTWHISAAQPGALFYPWWMLMKDSGVVILNVTWRGSALNNRSSPSSTLTQSCRTFPSRFLLTLYLLFLPGHNL